MSLALLTDLYQLTMAYGYWRRGLATDGTRAAFHLFFRTAPFGGHVAVAAGLEPAAEYLAGLQFTPDDLAYLEGLTGNDDLRLFEPAFLDWLEALRFDGQLDAVPEGEVVFPHTPLLRFVGNLALGQIVETALLNLLNFQTLVATKASRVVAAADGSPVLEFGLRRAQGIDGALAASRAAWIGGVAATSNVLAGKRFGIPVRGTHAHAWVMVHGDELEAFQAYAEVMPNNCTLLVDTYDTLEGVRRAITVGQGLRERGHRLAGVRLDSGDLHALSVEARRLLDAAGFHDTAIVASNDLDEAGVSALRSGGAAVSVFGVGTRLVTAYDQPALGGVYKLAAIARPGQPFEPRLKLSENVAKVSNPGIQGVRRERVDGRPVRDVIANAEAPLAGDLLVPVFRGGERVRPPEPLAVARARAAESLALFGVDAEHLGGRPYPVALDPELAATKERLVASHRAAARGA